MRAAVVTTALVIAALALWASVREVGRARAVASAREAALPPVAAGASYEPAAQTPREHAVEAGETLADLAARYYGDASRAGEIRDANRDRLGEDDAPSEGQVLVIP
jgi:nucleoid-associated protein YgaU